MFFFKSFKFIPLTQTGITENMLNYVQPIRKETELLPNVQKGARARAEIRQVDESTPAKILCPVELLKK